MTAQDVLRSQKSELEIEAEKIRQAIAALENAILALENTEYRFHKSPDNAPRKSPRKSRRSERIEDAILRLLAESADGSITSSAVRLATGAASHQIAAALRSLAAQGQIQRTAEIGARVAGRGPAPHVYRLAGAPQSRRTTREISKAT